MGKVKSKGKNERVVFATCTDEYKDVDYKDVWDKVIKNTLEEMYGKIKE